MVIIIKKRNQTHHTSYLKFKKRTNNIRFLWWLYEQVGSLYFTRMKTVPLLVHRPSPVWNKLVWPHVPIHSSRSVFRGVSSLVVLFQLALTGSVSSTVSCTSSFVLHHMSPHIRSHLHTWLAFSFHFPLENLMNTHQPSLEALSYSSHYD